MLRNVIFQVTLNKELRKNVTSAVLILFLFAVVVTVVHIVLLQTQMGIRNHVHFDTADAVASWRNSAIVIHVVFLVLTLITTGFALYVIDDRMYETSARGVTSQALKRKMNWTILPVILLSITCIVLLILTTLLGDGGRNANTGRVIWFHIWRSFFWVIPVAHCVIAYFATERKLPTFGSNQARRSRSKG